MDGSQSAETLNNFAALLVMRGDADRALPYLEAAVSADPSFAGAWFNLGTVLMERHLERAEIALRRAVELRPDHLGTRINLSTVLVQLGHIGESEIHAREAVRLQPRSVQAVVALAIALQHMGMHSDAIPLLKLAAEIEASAT